MKKTALLTVITCLTMFMAKAQLDNTKWQGTMKLPMQGGKMVDFQATLEFHQDTLTVTYAGGNLPQDVMVYSGDKNVFTIRKVSGGVPCDTAALGKVGYEIKNDQLFVKQLGDACAARGAADLSQPFTRVK